MTQFSIQWILSLNRLCQKWGQVQTVTINRLNDVTTVTNQDRTTGKVSTETFFGDSPFGK
jgi:hypothetical protein